MRLRLLLLAVALVSLVGCEPMKTGDSLFDEAMRKHAPFGFIFDTIEDRPGILRFVTILSVKATTVEDAANLTVRHVAALSEARGSDEFHIVFERHFWAIVRSRGGVQTSATPIPYLRGVITIGQPPVREGMEKFKTKEVLSAPADLRMGTLPPPR